MKAPWRFKETDLQAEFGLEIGSLQRLQITHYLHQGQRTLIPVMKLCQGSGLVKI